MANEELERLDDISSFLSLIGEILSIQSSIIERREQKNNNKANKVLIIAVYMASISAFIDLGIAKKNYDDLINRKDYVDPISISSAKDLLISRLFSVLAAIYLIKATLKQDNALLETPSGIAGIT